MAKTNVLELLYRKTKSIEEFNFDNLTAPPLLSLLSYQDIYELNKIARSVKLSGKIDTKYKMIDNIMKNRGFVKLHAGTNRVVYRFIEDQRFVVKVAVDKVGLGDNPAEYRNQFLLKPFVTKVFEVSPCGTVGLFERVNAVMSREEFASIADDVFNLITKVFVGKYVLEDFGCKYFMNYGWRNGIGPVLLDFPYVYELDGKKLYCNASPDPFHREIKCGGEIDYDDGFNNLICTKCGKIYQARELEKSKKNNLIIIGGTKTMNIKIKAGSDVILDSSKKKIAKVIEPEEYKEERIVKTIPKVSVNKPKDAIFNKIEEKVEEPVETKEDVIENIPEITEDGFVSIGDLLSNKIENIDNPLAELIAYVSSDTTVVDEEEIDAVCEESTIENSDEEVHKESSDDDKFENNLRKMEEELEEMERELNELEEEDHEEYDQYLSNRQRSEMKKEKKQNKSNSDFSGF